MKLELSQSLQQQQVLAPQMILSMDILLLSSLDLEQRVRKEFAENPALEIVEREASGEAPQPNVDNATRSGQEFNKLEEQAQYFREAPRRANRSDTDNKYEALQNTADKPAGLKDILTQQVHLRSLAEGIQETAEEIINNLDHRGYLHCSVEELRESMDSTPREQFDGALDAVRNLDPPGIGAENLQECLLLQLERDRQEYPLEKLIIESHLQDLGLNKIPKIAKDLGTTIDDIKDAVEIIASLDPIPGGRIESEQTIYIRPDVFVEVVNDEIEVRVDGGNLPDLKVSDSCRSVLKTQRGNRDVTDFVRKKIESAQWLIQAIQQRQRTLLDIAVAMTEFQKEFMLAGPEKLRAMKMQEMADIVGVHISTISRAIKGKHMQTPYGLFEMRFFFTGGVGTEDGNLESRRNVYRKISDLIEAEDKKKPLSDSELARRLRETGLQIARRTVTKYREQEGIPSSRLRKSY